jgi:hypothetical protein
MAAGVWLAVGLGVAVLVSSESSADDLGDAQSGSNGEELAVVAHTNGDVPPEDEVADAVATTPEGSESAGPRPLIRFENANPRMSSGGLVERRMGARSSYRERIRHRGVYSSRHGQPDLSGQIRHSGASTGRLARYQSRGRIRYDGVTRSRDRARIANIRVNWMGADRQLQRFGVPAY